MKISFLKTRWGGEGKLSFFSYYYYPKNRFFYSKNIILTGKI